MEKEEENKEEIQDAAGATIRKTGVPLPAFRGLHRSQRELKAKEKVRAARKGVDGPGAVSISANASGHGLRRSQQEREAKQRAVAPHHHPTCDVNHNQTQKTSRGAVHGLHRRPKDEVKRRLHPVRETLNAGQPQENPANARPDPDGAHDHSESVICTELGPSSGRATVEEHQIEGADFEESEEMQVHYQDLEAQGESFRENERALEGWIRNMLMHWQLWHLFTGIKEPAGARALSGLIQLFFILINL